MAERLEAPSLWEGLSGQLYLGSERFVKCMRKNATSKPTSSSTRVQKQPFQKNADQVPEDIARQYGLAPKIGVRPIQPRGD